MFKKFFSSSAPVQDRFHYDGLFSSSIRLLKIRDQSAGSKTVECELIQYEFLGCPPYTALSYTWGSERGSGTILLDGKSFRVRKNLLGFLEQATRSSRISGRLFWIDQICINQLNTEEKNEQVQKMGLIYKRAKDMIIWLGPPSWTRDSDLAMMTIGEAAQTLRNIQQQDPEGRMCLAQEEGAAVLRLLSRDYWLRLWIVQEISLVKDIQVWCGTMSVAFDDIVLLLNVKAPVYYETSSKGPVPLYPHLRDGTQMLFLNRHYENEQPAAYNRMAALINFASNEAFDPRDKLYGLLGIIVGEHNISVDYKKSTAEVFLDVVNWRQKQEEKGKQGHGNLDDILDAGEDMGVIRRDKQRLRSTLERYLLFRSLRIWYVEEGVVTCRLP